MRKTSGKTATIGRAGGCARRCLVAASVAGRRRARLALLRRDVPLSPHPAAATSSSSRSTRCAPTRLGAYGSSIRGDAVDRSPCRRRPPLRQRARAQRRHAAVARQHPHRPAASRPRRARQRRLPPRRDRGDAGDAAAGRRVSHRRVRQRVSARLALRPGARVRRLRRRVRGCGAAAGVPRAGAGRRGRPSPRRSRWMGRASVGSARAGRSRGSPGSISTSRTIPTRRRSRMRSRFRRGSVRGRSRGGRCGAGPLLHRSSMPGPTTDTLVVVTSDHGESLGDHGEATHGIFAYEATLKVPLDRSTIRRSRRRASSTPPAATSTSCRRSSMRIGHARSVRPARPEPDCAARPPARPRLHLLRGAVGIAQSRLGAAVGHRRERNEVHRSADPRALRPPSGSRRSAQPGAERRRRSRASRRCSGRWRSLDVRRADETPEVRERLRSLGYVTSNAPRRREGRTPRPTIPSG